VPAALWQLCRRGAEAYPDWCASLQAASGIDAEWTRSGMLVRGVDEVGAALAWGSEQGIACTPGIEANSVWLPWVGQVRNPRLCRALAVVARQAGVVIHEHAGAAALDCRGGTARVQAGAASWQPDAVVVSAGAWSAALLAPTGWDIPVAPVKGEMLALQAAPGAVPWVVLEGSRYLIPRRDGTVLVGSTSEPGTFNTEPTAAVGEALRAFAARVVPALAAAPLVAHWAGLRPGSPDGIPILAEHPGCPGLFAHTGHFRYGLTLAPETSRLMAERVGAHLALR
jgi:glycine oxidase